MTKMARPLAPLTVVLLLAISSCTTSSLTMAEPGADTVATGLDVR